MRKVLAIMMLLALLLSGCFTRRLLQTPEKSAEPQIAPDSGIWVVHFSQKKDSKDRLIFCVRVENKTGTDIESFRIAVVGFDVTQKDLRGFSINDSADLFENIEHIHNGNTSEAPIWHKMKHDPSPVYSAAVYEYTTSDNTVVKMPDNGLLWAVFKEPKTEKSAGDK